MQAQKGSSDIVKIMITETTDERPGADVDDGFATRESELAVYSGEAAERETLAGNGIVMARAGSTARVVVRAGSTAREQATRSEQFKGRRRIRRSQQDPHIRQSHSTQEDA